MRFPRPCRFVARRLVFACELAIGEALPEHLAQGKLEPLAVVQVFAVVVAETLSEERSRSRRLYFCRFELRSIDLMC